MSNTPPLAKIELAAIRYVNPEVAEKELRELPAEYARRMFLHDVELKVILQEAIEIMLDLTEDEDTTLGPDTYKHPWLREIQKLATSKPFLEAAKNAFPFGGFDKPQFDSLKPDSSYDVVNAEKVSWALSLLSRLTIRSDLLKPAAQAIPGSSVYTEYETTAFNTSRDILLKPIILTLDLVTDLRS